MLKYRQKRCKKVAVRRNVANTLDDSIDMVEEAGKSGRDIVGSAFDDIKPTQDIVNTGWAKR